MEKYYKDSVKNFNRNYKEVSCDGIEEWLEWRKGGVGSSDIASLLGVGYQSPYQVWEDKTGFSKPKGATPAMIHGVKSEPKARSWLENEWQIELNEINMEARENPIFRCSLDGYNEKEQLLVEIKSPVSEKVWYNIYEGNIPIYWQYQIQWQIMISGCIDAYLAVWDDKREECLIFSMGESRDLQNRMKEEAICFWKQVVLGIPPEKTSQDGLEELTVEDAILDFSEYEYIHRQIKELEEKKKKAREKCMKWATENSFKCGNVQVIKKKGPDRYNFKKMADDGLPVDNYKTSGTEYVTLKVVG